MSMNRATWQERVADEIASTGIVDAHEHILGREQREQINPDLFDWIEASYYYAALLASGMSPDEFRSRGHGDAPRRWQVMRPHLQRTRTSAYAHIIDLATRDLFDFPFTALNDDNWSELSTQIQAANMRRDWFDVVFGQKLKVQVSWLDLQAGGTLASGVRHPGGWYDYILRVRPTEDNNVVNRRGIVRQIDTPYFKPVFKIDTLIYGYGQGVHTEIKQLFGVDAERVETLDEYLHVVDQCFENIVARGAVGIKSAISGLRTLEFVKTDKAAAGQIFELTPEEIAPHHAQAFENYMMHVIVQKSVEHHLPFQIHTGTSYAGFSRDANSHADHLFNLIAAYPDARFDLFHGGFPYVGESASLASRFPNVYLNFAWFTMLAPTEARRALTSWVELVPMHKFSWGGDCFYVEETYGAFLLARRIVADALYDKMEEGWLDEATALEFARGMFHDNSLRLFENLLLPKGKE
jgi:hypothetical protein